MVDLTDLYASATVIMNIAGPTDVPLPPKTASTPRAAMLFIKSMIGTFVLYLPYLFSLCGVATGSIVIAIVAVISTWNMMLLANCHDIQGPLGASSYGEIGAIVYGHAGRIAVDVSILLAQLGCCITQILYLTKNIIEDAGLSVDKERGYTDHASMIILGGLTLLLAPLAWIRRIQYLGTLMMIANVCVFAGFFSTFANSTIVLAQFGPANVDWVFAGPNGMLLFVGSVSICFEGVGVLLPIKQSMAHPEHFKPMVLTIMVALALLFAGFGIVGYLAFGDDVQLFVTLNLPPNGMGVIVRTVYALAIFLSYPLQLFPAVEILERVVFYWARHEPRGTYKWYKNAFRAFVVAFTAFVALMTGDTFSNFIAVVGALCSVPLAMIYPPLIHVKLASASLSTAQRVVEIAVAALGACLMVVCTANALRTWRS